MYRQAISIKKKGAVTASVITGIFLAVSLATAFFYPVCWAIFGFCALFFVLIIFSVIQNSNNIRKMEQSYPGFLESDIDRCTDHVAGKYFFLEKYLVDPFNARMIRYDDIGSVKALESTDNRTGVRTKRESRTVSIRRRSADRNSMPMIFNDFCDGMAHSDSQSVMNYERFMALLTSHLPDDTEVNVKKL